MTTESLTFPCISVRVQVSGGGNTLRTDVWLVGKTGRMLTNIGSEVGSYRLELIKKANVYAQELDIPMFVVRYEVKEIEEVLSVRREVCFAD